MKQLKIALDCDDVIVPTAPLILRNYNATYGTKIGLKDFYTNDRTPWGTDDATAVKRVEAYLMSDEYQQVEPFLEGIEVIRQLGGHHELHIVTGRPGILAKATEDMLEKYFPSIFHSIEFTHFFGPNPRSKATVCQDLGIDLLVDDHLHHAQVVAACGIDALLFGNYPWNKTDSLPPRIRRVNGWHDVAQLLLP